MREGGGLKIIKSLEFKCQDVGSWNLGLVCSLEYKEIL